MRYLRHLAVSLILCSALLLAQDETPTRVTNQNRMGELPYSTSIGTDIEHVDLATGALNVNIPIWSVPGRGMDATLSFHWNSNYLIAASRIDGLGNPYFIYNKAKNSGWQSNHPALSFTTVSEPCIETGGTVTARWNTNYIYYDEQGGQHTLALQSGGGLCNTGGNNNTGPDLSAMGLWATVNGGLKLSDGAFVGVTTGPDLNPLLDSTAYKDANGNTRSANTDTLGRSLYTAVDAPFDPVGRPTQTTFTVQDPNGMLQNIVVTWQPLSITTNFGTIGVREASGVQWYAIQSISLPNGTAYRFQYEPDYGELKEIDLPTGGVVTYAWANFTQPNPGSTIPDQESRRYVSSRTEIVNGVSNTWTFQLSTPIPGYEQDLVTYPPVSAPSGGTIQNQSVFLSDAGNLIDAKIYSGAATGTPVREFNMQYQSDGDPTVGFQDCTGAGGPSPLSQPMGARLTRLTTILDNGVASKKEFAYDSLSYTFYGNRCGMAEAQHPAQFTASRGNITAIREYGFGTASGPVTNMDVPNAPLLRTTTRTYWHDSHSTYIGPNIVDRVASEVVTDNVANAVASQTQYSYDLTAIQSITNLASVPAHDSTFTSSVTTRGNPTQVARWNNADGSWLTTTYNYDDLGNIRSVLDPKNNRTIWSYDDSFDAATNTCPPASNSYAYVSKKTDPANHNFYVTRRACTGHVASHQNDNDVANGVATTYSYDEMGRVLQKTLADGGFVKTDYHNDPVPPFVTTTTAAAPDPDLIQDSYFDGLHRLVQTQLHAPGSNVIADTTYDALGRVASLSNPHGTLPASTDGSTSTIYDALSRPVVVKKQDNSMVGYSYAGTKTTITDEAGKQRATSTDALGRLVEVDEPQSGSVGTSATASVTISGSLSSAKSSTGSAPLPLSGSSLTSFVAPDGSSHIFYVASGQHVLHMFWNSSGGWQDVDLFSTTGAVPATNSALSGVALADGTLHVFYTGANQHIYQFVYASGGWQSQDLTAITGNVLAASGTALASDAGAAGEPVHVYYLGANQHIYCLFISGTTWQNQDLTAATGNTLAAAGSKLAVSVLADGTTRLFYLGTNQHVYQLFRNNGGSFGTPYLASTDYTDAQGWYQSAYYPSIRLADVNGDGKPDVCGRGQAGVGCSLNNGSGAFAARQQWETSFSDGFGWNQLPYGSTFMFADLNGDHKADACARGISGVICEPSTGSSFGAGYYASTDYNDSMSWNSAYYYPSLRLADVNGDGKPDVCGRGSLGVDCSVNNGSGTFAAAQQWDASFTDANGWNQPQYTSTIMFADINGDGKADVCGRGQAGIICALSTGSAFGTTYVASTDFSDAEGWSNAAYYSSIRLADVNGDGKPDVCGRGATGVVCALNNGNGTFGPARQWDGNFTDAFGWNLAQYTSTMMFADINGDGRADVCGRGQAGIECALSTGNASWQNQDLTAITGNTLGIAGSSLTSDAGAAGNPIHVYYIGSNQHIYSLYWNSSTLAWTNFDITANTGNTLPATGSQLSVSVASDGTTHVFYLGSNQHVYQLLCCTSNWQNQDLTAVSGNTLALAGTALTSTGLAGGGNIAHLYYQIGTLHLNHLSLSPGSTWTNEDLSTSESTLIADSGTVSLTAAGFTVSACFGPSTNPACSGQQLNDTTTAVASALAQAFNVLGSTVSATVAGSTINFTLLQPGPFTPPISPLTTAHDNSSLFTNPSFTSPATNFADGAGTSFTNGYTTLYSYDALGNLACVVQRGTDTGAFTSCAAAPAAWRPRSFSYDSLSRLLTAHNPESGTIIYSYDPDGNVSQKTSPAPNQTGTATTTISYCYDADNRPLAKGYANSPNSPQQCSPTPPYLPNPAVTNTYDVGANGIGYLTSLTDQAGSGIYTYDLMGRIMTEQRTIAGITKSISYGYDLADLPTQITYPSTRVVNYTADSAGRAISAIDGNLTGYATAASYNAAGTLAGFASGSSITNSFLYNPRLQLCRITAWTSGSVPGSCTDSAVHGNLMDRGYNFSFGSGDNGNVLGITNYRDATRSQSFTYDSLNRIVTGSSSGNTGALSWGENYTIDAWGNLQISPMAGKAHGGMFQHAGDVNNRASGLGYDAAGNLTNYTAPGQYVYDSENRIQSTGGTTYTYDADGDRVEKSNGSTGTLYWYGAAGILAESDLAGNIKSEYVFFNGKRTARVDSPGNTIHYYLSDHLNSTSIVVSSAGAIEEESDYSPFGTEYVVTGPGANHYKFTGKERDTESGLDYFGARYYSSAMTRFMTVDPSSKSISKLNPQSWNRYSDTLNNPLRFVDDNGKWPKDIHEQIIDRAFPGLSASQRNELKRTSAWVDRLAGQTKAHNHEHAMKSPGDNPATANRAIDQNIQNHEQAAQRAQGGTPEHAAQINNGALREFGQALHTVEDRTSPAHTDADSNPRDWNGIPGTPSGYEAVKQHEAEESTISPEQMNNSVQAARDAFSQTFGQKAEQEAQTPPPPPPKKEEPK